MTVVGTKYALVHENSGGTWWRLDIDTGELLSIDVAPPPGLAPLADSCGFPERSLAQNGDAYFPLRNASVAAFHALDPASGAYSPLGRPLAAPGLLTFGERANTFILAGGDGSDTFCPIVDWTEAPPPDAAPHGVVQIVRPDIGAAHEIEAFDPWAVPWAFSIAVTGLCVAVPDAALESLELLDVATGERVPAPGPGEFRFLD
jgi:hypothetical protein